MNSGLEETMVTPTAKSERSTSRRAPKESMRVAAFIIAIERSRQPTSSWGFFRKRPGIDSVTRVRAKPQSVPHSTRRRFASTTQHFVCAQLKFQRIDLVREFAFIVGYEYAGAETPYHPAASDAT